MRTRALLLALVVTSQATPSAAETPRETPPDVARADQLFEEGKQLQATDLAGACAKFEASLALNPQAIGTLLNVARCDQELGRIASAHARFREAQARAQEQGRDAEREAATARLAELGPRLPLVTVTFAEPPLPGTRLVIDEHAFALTALVDLPLDPGAHEVVVSAPGHLPFRASVSAFEGRRSTVTIPALERAVAAASSRRRLGLLTAGGGVVVLGAAAVIGVVAYRRYQAPFDDGACRERADGQAQCTPDGYGATNSARTLGVVGSVVTGVGLTAVAIGSYLWLRAPERTREHAVSLIPSVTLDQAGIAAVGRF